jgi:ubiquinone/menaquinone biosynthesis C-methylase UbiE
MTDPHEIVRAGYDRMADRFEAWRGGIEGSPERTWVEDLLTRLSREPDVLELGVGAAIETTRIVAKRGRLVGVDISSEQVRRARERLPGGRFIHDDMTQIEFDPESFDAVVSVYAFNHVPRAELPPLLERIARWLRPGGYVLATFGISGGEGVQDDWLGVPMFFASYTDEENRELIRKAGLEIERDEIVTIVEPEEGEGRFQWVLARRPGPPPPAAGGGDRT